MKLKRIFSFILALATVFSLLPSMTFVSEAEEAQSTPEAKLYEYKFNYKALNGTAAIKIDNAKGTKATGDGTAPWTFLGQRSMNGGNFLAESMSYTVKIGNLAYPNNAMAIAVEVGEAGIYYPSITVATGPDRQIATYYLVKSTGEDLSTTGNIKTYLNNTLKTAPILGKIDCYAETKGTKTESFDPIMLEAGTYNFVMMCNESNPAVVPLVSGSNTFISHEIKSLKLAGFCSLEATAEKTELAIGGTVSIITKATFADDSVVTVEGAEFVSSNPAAATVTAEGLVTAAAAGNTTITATYGTLSKKVAITVTEAATDEITALALSATKNTLDIDETAQLSAVATWSVSGERGHAAAGLELVSSNPGVATVDANGVVTAVAPGTATITATVKDTAISDTVEIEVLAPAVQDEILSIKLTVSKTDLMPGAAAQLSAKATWSVGGEKDLALSALELVSSNPAAAAVNASGVVTAVASGKVTITATLKENALISDSVTVEVLTTALSDEAYHYLFNYKSLGNTTATKIGSAIGVRAASNGTAPWTFLQERSMNGGNFLADSMSYTVKLSNMASPNNAMVISVEVAEGGTYYPSITVATGPDRQIATYYLVKANGETFPNTGAVKSYITGTLNNTTPLGKIDCYSETKGEKTVVFAPVVLASGTYHFVMMCNETNPAVVPLTSGSNQYITHEIKALKLDGRALKSVDAAAEKAELAIYETTNITTKLTFADDSVLAVEEVTYTSSNPAIATVDAKGVVTAVAAGDVTITASYGGKTKEVAIKVLNVALADELQSVEVSSDKAVLEIGETSRLSVEATWSLSGKKEHAAADTEFVSANPAIVTVDANGVVTAAGAGKTTVTATAKGTGVFNTVEIEVLSADLGNAGVTITYNTGWTALSGDKLPQSTAAEEYKNGTYARKADGGIIMNEKLMNRYATSVINNVGATVAEWRLMDMAKTAAWDIAFAPVPSTAGVRIFKSTKNGSDYMYLNWETGDYGKYAASNGTLLPIRISVSNKGEYSLWIKSIGVANGIVPAVYVFPDDGSITSAADIMEKISSGDNGKIGYHSFAKVSGDYQYVGKFEAEKRGEYFVVFHGDSTSLEKNGVTTKNEGKYQEMFLQSIQIKEYVQDTMKELALLTSAANLEAGDTAQLTAKAIWNVQGESELDPSEVTFVSSDTAVATVNASGVVTAVANGTATVTATLNADPNMVATVKINVLDDAIANIEITASGEILEIGETAQISGKATWTVSGLKDIAAADVGFTTDKPGVATVDANGVVTAVGAGKVTVTATAKGTGVSGSVQIEVLPEDPGNDGVTLNYNTGWTALSGDKLPLSTNSSEYASGTYARNADGGMIVNERLMNRYATSVINSVGATVAEWRLMDMTKTAAWDVAFAPIPSAAGLRIFKSTKTGADYMFLNWKVGDYGRHSNSATVLPFRISVSNKGEYTLAIKSIGVADGVVPAVYVFPDDGSITSIADLQAKLQSDDNGFIGYHSFAKTADGYQFVGKFDAEKRGEYFVVFHPDETALTQNPTTSTDGKYQQMLLQSIQITKYYPDEITKIDLTSTLKQLKMNKTAQISAMATWRHSGLKELKAEDITFKSSDPQIATVDAKGVVTGLKAGKVTVTATAKGTNVSGIIELEVLGPPVYNSQRYEYIFTCFALGQETRYNFGLHMSNRYTDPGWVKKDMIVLGQPWQTETSDPSITSGPLLEENLQYQGRVVAEEKDRPLLNNHAITFSLQVDEPGTYFPVVEVMTSAANPVAKYYITRKTGTEDLSTQEKMNAWVASLGTAEYVGQIDCYGAEGGIKSVALAPVKLEKGDYMFTIKLDGANPNYAPQESNGYLYRYQMTKIILDSCAPQSISLSSDTRFIVAGETTAQLTTSITMENGKVYQLDGATYESLNPEFATVDQFGIVTGVTPGQATLKVTYEGGFEETITIDIIGDMAPSGEKYDYIFNSAAAGSNTNVSLVEKANVVMTNGTAPWAYKAGANVTSAILGGDRMTFNGTLLLSIKVDKGGMYIPTAQIGVGPEFENAQFYLRPVTGNEDFGEGLNEYIGSLLASEHLGTVWCNEALMGTKTVQFPRQQLEAGEYILVIKSTGDCELSSLTLDGTAPKKLNLTVEPDVVTKGNNQAEAVVTMEHESGNVYTAEGVTFESLSPSVATVDAFGIVCGLATGSTTIKATYKSAKVTLTAEAEVTVDGDPFFTYKFDSTALGKTGDVTGIMNVLANKNGSATWQLYGVRYGNSYRLNDRPTHLYFNARSSSTPGIPQTGTGYVLLLDVAKDGTYLPTLTVGTDADRQIAKYYLAKKGNVDLKGTSANIATFISGLDADSFLCEIDCYSESAGSKTVVLPQRELEKGEYYLIVTLTGCNENVVPLKSGNNYYVVNSIQSLKLDGTKVESLVVTADRTVIDLKGVTAQLAAAAKYESGMTYSLSGVTYESLNPGIATVDANGIVTGVSLGTAEIKATVAGVGTSTVKITVREDASLPEKDGRTYYTDEMVTAARENIWNYSWARSHSNVIVQDANTYVWYIDEIYDLIHSEGLPRSNSITLRDNPNQWICPSCGENLYTEYGHYPWTVDWLNDPWKIQCPVCRDRFPSNDFESFYELGLNEKGEFDRMRALEAHRQMLLDKGIALSNEKPAEYTDKTMKTPLPDGWYEYYGYGVKGGYLYNEINRDVDTSKFKTGETLNRWGVDDGWGYGTGEVVEATGREERYTYIAYFSHWGIWSQNAGGGKAVIARALSNLSRAYLYTGNLEYGRACAIIVDRIADFYPDYFSNNWTLTYANADGGASTGHILGSIWEAFFQQTLAKAYDAVWPLYEDAEVISYITEKAIEQGRGEKLDIVNGKLTATPVKLRIHVENNLIRKIRDTIYRGGAKGNFGVYQAAMATAAVVLDSHPETDEMIDWIFRDETGSSNTMNLGGNVSDKLISSVSRDGMGTESGAGYNILWIEQLIDAANALANYDEYSGVSLYEHPKYIAMIQNWKGLTMLREGVPGIGDSGAAAAFSKLPADTTVLSAYSALKDSEDPAIQEIVIELAQQLYWLCDGYTEKLSYDIFSKDPDIIGEEIENIVEQYGEWDFDKSNIMSGYGFAALREGTLGDPLGVYDSQRDVWMYFGGAESHANSDNLHIGIDAFGTSITSDLGYPEATGRDANRIQWQNATLAHNTVVVDEMSSTKGEDPQKPLYFEGTDSRVKVMDVDGAESYAQTQEYRRTVVMVNYDQQNSYTIDFFKILGGDDHLYSFHVDSDIDATYSSNLKFVQQYGGSYASPDVEQGQDPWTQNAWVYETKYPLGYSWLGDVKRADNPGIGSFWVDYRIPDARNISHNGWMDLHVRLTAVNDWDADEVTLTQGWPPRGSKNLDYLDHLEYLLVRRTGSQLNTLFTTVIEPYDGKRFIKNISEVTIEAVSGARPAKTDLAKAVKVELADGRIDYVVYAQNSNVIYKITDEATGYSFNFNGTVGVWTVIESEKGFENVYSYVCNGTMIGEGSEKQQSRSAALTGKIIGFSGYNDNDNALTFDSWIDVQFDNVTVPAEGAAFNAFAKNLENRIFVGQRSGSGNTVYTIQDVERIDSKSVRIKIGNISLINGYTVSETGKQIYTYDVAVRQSFSIPMSYERGDQTPPTGTLTIGNRTWSNLRNYVEYDMHFGTEQTVTVTAADDGIGVLKTEYFVAEGGTRNFHKVNWKRFTNSFTIRPENGEYVVYVKITDRAGNVKIINSTGLVFDDRNPILRGIEDGKTYYKQVEVTVDETYLDRVEVNGRVIAVVDGKFILTPSDKPQTVVAYDKTGNVSAVVTVTVNANHAGFVWGDYYKTTKQYTYKVAECICGTRISITVPNDGLEIGGLDTEAVLQLESLRFVKETDVTKLRARQMDAIKAKLEANMEVQFIGLYVQYERNWENLYETTTVLEIPIAFDFSGKSDVAVYRHRDGLGHKFTELTERPTENFADSTYYLDKEAGLVYVYANMYAVYGIAYHPHTLTNVPAVKATLFKDGVAEYWHCDICDKKYADENAMTEVTDAQLVVEYTMRVPVILAIVLVPVIGGAIATILVIRKKKKKKA